MTFQKYGLGIDIYSSIHGVITENGSGTGALFPKSTYDSGHKDHMHLQGFKFDYLMNIFDKR